MNPFTHTLILGHRGSPREAAENTLESLYRAVAAGADGVEMDVQRSLDGIPVVIHDDSLERVWKIRKLVSQLHWPAIAKLTEARIPSFEQVAAWAGAAGAWLNVELKSDRVEAGVARIIEEMRIADRVIVSSFDPEIVRRVGEVAPDLRRFFLTERWDADARARFERSDASGVCLRDNAADSAALEDLDRNHLPVIVWTVNEPARVRDLLAREVAGIITDLPAMAVAERMRLSAG